MKAETISEIWDAAVKSVENYPYGNNIWELKSPIQREALKAFARACEQHGMTRQLEWLRTVPSGGFNIHEHDIAPFQAEVAKENEDG